jgi:hypothetical protein
MLIVTQPRVGTAHNEIIALQMAAQASGWDVCPAPSSWRLEEEMIQSKAVGVPYGSQLFCEVIAQQMGWTLKQNSFDWLAKLPQKLTHRKIDFMTLAEAKKITSRKFIKPADDKCFDAKVYEPGEFQPHSAIEDNYPVLVSDIVSWDAEYRCFVGKDESRLVVTSWSNYLFHGQINDSKMHKMLPGNLIHIRTFMEDVLWECFKLDIETVPSVIDVGLIPGKGWAVVETNPAWASGLYGCDPVEALKVMEQACE